MKVREIDFRSGIDGSKGRCIGKESWLKRGRQQIDGSAAWWATMEATSKAIVGIAWEGGGVDDSYRGSKIAALIPDDRTPEGAL
ncbi:hypothetical protein BHM03_00015524 [Ensete ventricosum]|nr:hypothetical protein BHM03_00015524 [Ensete ventricosum]